MFQKVNEKRKNQSCSENKVHVSRDKNEKSFDYNNSFARVSFKKHDNLNKEEHKMKSEQIIKRTTSQRIRNALLKTKKQYKLIREEKTFR